MSVDIFNNFYQNKKILLTGHTGFKGSWLAIWLKGLGADVYGYALEPTSSEDNFVVCAIDKKINHKIGNILDKKELFNYFAEVKPDIVFHLAAQALVLESYENPSYNFEVNIQGTINVLEAIRQTNSVKSAIMVTSDKCYDNKEWIWGYRENEAFGGKDPYSASKGACEIVIQSYIHSFFQKENSCNVASVRAGNVIGGGDWAKDRIIPDFFRALAKNESLKIRNPHATRPWQFVLEPLRGYMLLAQKLFLEGKKYQGGWNFGPDLENAQNVKTLIENIISNTKKGSLEITENHQAPHEATFLHLDITKANHYLGWKPLLNFEKTIEFVVNTYQTKENFWENRILQIENYTKSPPTPEGGANADNKL